MRIIAAITFFLPSLLISATPVLACDRPGSIQLAPGYAYANLYQSASVSSQVLAQLGNGQPICTLGIGPNFRKVQAGSLVGCIKNR